MKKWLIRCLTVLAMVCLIPGIVLKAAAETVPVYCSRCGIREEREVRRYEKYDSTYHKVCVDACQNCHNDGNVSYLQVHTGGTQGPTCTEGKICEDCGAEYDIPGHKWITPANSSLGNGTHRIICLRCGLNGTASCSGGYATCTSPGVCAACGGSYYGGHDLVQHAAKAPTCTEIGWDAYDTCSRFGCNYTTRKELPALKHDLKQHAAKAPTCTEIGWDAYEACSRCDYTTYVELPAQHDLEHHAAKAPTCTEPGWNAYDTCGREGCGYTTYQELDALGHSYEARTVQPNCTKKGYTLHTCVRCEDSYTDAVIPSRGHWYGEWSPNGDAASSADCRRNGCRHTGKVLCEPLVCRLLLKNAEAYDFTLCPVCGEVSDGARLTLIEEAKATAQRLPRGELVLRIGDLQNGERMLSVGFEYGGRLTQPTGQVEITLPAAMLDGYALMLLDADGAETALPHTLNGDEATFTLDFTTNGDPALALRLISVS